MNERIILFKENIHYQNFILKNSNYLYLQIANINVIRNVAYKFYMQLILVELFKEMKFETML